MATRGASLAQSGRGVRPRPAERPERGSAPELGVLDRRHLIARGRRRQARVLTTLAALCVAGPLLLAALGHAVVVSDQVRADALESEIAQALQTQQDYQLQKAELVAPSRILSIAETRLHMVTPSAVTYLPPVNPGESVAQAHAPNALRARAPAGAVRAAGSGRASDRSATALHPVP